MCAEMERDMRKLLLYLLLLISMVVVLAGCKGNEQQGSSDAKQQETGSGSKANTDNQENTSGSEADNTSSEPVELTIWHDKEEAVASVLQAELDKLAPQIVVTLIKKEGLTDALKLVGNDPKSAPDMYFFAHDKIGVYAEMGILAPITDFISEDVYKNYMDVTVSAAKYKDEIYQLPLYYETLLFMYNKEYMSEDEVPTTTEGLYTYMKENTTGDRYGFVEQHSTAYYSIPWIHGFGGTVIDEQGIPELNSAQSVQALTYHKKFVDYMPGESDYNTVNILFLEGMADSIIGGPWLVPSIRSRGIDLGFASMPVVDETGLPLAPYSGTQGIHVLKVAAEKKKAAITEVLNLLTNTDIGIAMANASGCAPANKLCYEDETVKQDEMVMMMKDTAEKAVSMPNLPEMDVMWSVTSNMLASINMSGGDPSEEARKAQKEAEDLIAAMK